MKDETVKLMRHSLGSIDLSDVEDKDITEQERKDYCAAIHAVLPRLEKDLKRFMYQQALFTAKEAANWEQVAFGRGTLDGVAMLLEHWTAAHQEHINNSSNKDFDKHNPISEM